MSVASLTLGEFSVFRDAEFAFSPGLNVLIGANATGKSHVVKLLYSILKIKRWAAPPGGPDSSAIGVPKAQEA
jgi:predicted ATP-dependent endonuclease of OLD family